MGMSLFRLEHNRPEPERRFSPQRFPDRSGHETIVLVTSDEWHNYENLFRRRFYGKTEVVVVADTGEVIKL